MRLYLVRHAKTEWNALGRFQGSLDSPLTEEGIRKTRKLADALGEIPLDGAYVSTLGRAQKTAEILLANRDIPLTVDSRIDEMNMGHWEGMTHAEIRAENPEALERYFTTEIDFAAPEGESYRKLYKRVEDFVHDLPHTGRYLIVTHGMTLFFLTEILKGKTVGEIGKVRILEGATLTLYEGEETFVPVFEEHSPK